MNTNENRSYSRPFVFIRGPIRLHEQLVDVLNAIVHYSNRSATRSRQLRLERDSQRVENCRSYFGGRGGPILGSRANIVGCADNLAAFDTATRHHNGPA